MSSKMLGGKSPAHQTVHLYICSTPLNSRQRKKQELTWQASFFSVDFCSIQKISQFVLVQSVTILRWSMPVSSIKTLSSLGGAACFGRGGGGEIDWRKIWMMYLNCKICNSTVNFPSSDHQQFRNVPTNLAKKVVEFFRFRDGMFFADPQKSFFFYLESFSQGFAPVL